MNKKLPLQTVLGQLDFLQQPVIVVSSSLHILVSLHIVIEIC